MISLDEYNDCAVEVKSGASKKYCFNIKGKEYFFKENYVQPSGVVCPNHIVEVLCSRILEKVGCKDFVRYYFAEFNGQLGCVSESFKNKNDVCELSFYDIMIRNYAREKLNKNFAIDEKVNDDIVLEFEENVVEKINKQINGKKIMYELSIESLLNDLTNFCSATGLNYNKDEIVNKLLQMIIFDYFCYNDDRNWSNILFVVDKNKNLSLTPIFDNGMSFGLQNYPNNAHNYIHLGISQVGEESTFEENSILQKYGLLVADILQLVANDSELNEYVENFLQLDIEQEVEDVENEIKMEKNLKFGIFRLYHLRVKQYNLTKEKIDKKISKFQNKEK